MQEPIGRRHGLGAAWVAGLAVVWVLVLAHDAHAYIDPSAGGMLVQLLLAGTAGVAVLGKLFWMRIRRAIGMAPPEPETPAAETSPAEHDRV